MSACAAVFHRDQRPATAEELDKLLDPMAYRGADGTHRWVSGSFALGYQEFCVLPEDRGIAWPIRTPP